jgi:ATP-dependent Clp protease ATP-binding subunit ClpC
MLFTKQNQVPILSCNTCQGTGYTGMRRCTNCHRMSMGRLLRDNWLYFGEPLTRYHIAVRRMRRWLRKFELLGSFLFMVASFAVFFWILYSSEKGIDQLFTPEFWIAEYAGPQVLFWTGFIFLGFFIYRVMRVLEPRVVVEPRAYQAGDETLQKEEEVFTEITWQQVKKVSRRKRKNIASTFDHEAQQVLEVAYKKADEKNNKEMTPVHLFYALLGSTKISNVFIRLGVPVKVLRAKLAEGFQHEKITAMPRLSVNMQQILFHAYEEAYKARQDHVHVTELLIAVIRQSEFLQEVLYDLNVDEQKLTNVVEWIRIRQRLQDQRKSFRKAASHRDKHGLDKAMTAVATPYLNSLSKDITMAAVFGHLPACVAREKELQEMFRVVESGRQSILLVGDHGVGKMTLIQGLVQRMIEDDVPKRLQDKRLVQLSTSALLAGTTVSGAQERLIHLMNEVRKAKNIILFIDNIHNLIGGAGGGEGLDVSESLSQFISSSNVLLFATTTQEGYTQHISRSQIGSALSKIDVNEMSENQTIQVLEAKVGIMEYKHKVFYSYDALEASAKFAGNFLHEQQLPESAIELMSEAGSYAKNKKGENSLVEKDHVAAIITQKTGIPVSSLTEDESSKLLRLEEEMHKRVIGQTEAVQVVANALRRARAAIRSTKRPIANFLFLGSTGVGKTELAKTIADTYFGGEDRMVRIDMSEYQEASGIYRLIGQPGQQGTGILTEAVRQQPFSLVLLDEMEKADPKILDLFLQVFDDGRLTDSVGRVVDFTNTIIIATSNAGTGFIQEGIRAKKPLADIREDLMKNVLKQHFRPEFLNRFDGMVVFTPLELDEVRQIAKLMLKRVAADMETRGIEFRVDDAGLDVLAKAGFDPEFGARPMRRAIQELIENKLAEMVLHGELKRRDVVVFDGDGFRIGA